MDDPKEDLWNILKKYREQVIGWRSAGRERQCERILDELRSRYWSPDSGKIIQNRETVHPGTYIGKGKIEEVRVYAGHGCYRNHLTMSFPPAQMNNLEHELECKVMDRTLLILGYFCKNMPPQVRVRSR